jgi:hypothetical protein
MSNVNIKRAVENIRSGTNPYTPIVEVVVNAIDAIERKKEKRGEIIISVKRSIQMDLDEKSLLSIEGFEITDNGIGFNDANRDSFDTLYSDQKISTGGKGFGRFTCLKYFNNFNVESVFEKERKFQKRIFCMGKINNIIVDEKIEETDLKQTGSIIRLENFKKGNFPDKKLSTISRRLVEKLLPYFISEDYSCPKIKIVEEDNSDPIILNDYVNNEISSVVQEIILSKNEFNLGNETINHDFSVRVFKFYSPKNQKSKISLVAHKREVIETSIYNYIPEFIDEFYDKENDGESSSDKNYVIKAYVFGEYLDGNVEFERGGFTFQKENDLLLGVSQNEIETKAALIAKEAVGSEVTARQEKKAESVKHYIENEAPWHRSIGKNIDLLSLPYNPSPEDIEEKLQKEKYKQEKSIKREVGALLESSDIENQKKIHEIVSKISEASKNDLTHYIALRRYVLDIFKKSLEFDPKGNYSSEGAVHDIIFPRHGDSEETSFGEHNLWIIDERLNFTNYVSSDKPLNNGNSERPDLLVYDNRVLFRGDNEASNPVTVFEFKRPQRDDFANPSSKEDPVQQIIRYVNSIKEGDFKTPEGRDILVAENTPFYGYVICDLTKKVEKWLKTEKGFKSMPDALGWFWWHENINLYIEVLSWDKVLKDAGLRNKIFFHKLGI